MKRLQLAIAAFFSLALPLAAQSADTVPDDTSVEEPLIVAAEDVVLEDLLWIKRPLVVFADTDADPRFIQQMQFINDRLEDLVERDVLVITDTNPDEPSAIREKLRPRGFMLALIGKDGQVKLRKPLPWSVRELSRSIDKMPTRQQEIRDRRGD